MSIQQPVSSNAAAGKVTLTALGFEYEINFPQSDGVMTSAVELDVRVVMWIWPPERLVSRD